MPDPVLVAVRPTVRLLVLTVLDLLDPPLLALQPLVYRRFFHRRRLKIVPPTSSTTLAVEPASPEQLWSLLHL